MTSPDLPVQNPRRRSPAAPTARGGGADARVTAARAVDLDQPFDADGLYGLRAALAAHASRVGAPDEQIDHLLIVASELAANAIRHGGGSGRLLLWHDGDILYCQVSDRGTGIADTTVGSTAPDPTRGNGGRGMWICRNLAEELVIETGPNGRGATVTATIPRPATT